MKIEHVDHPFQSPAVLSFCPGVLGIERGLERAGIKCRVAAYVEIEAFIIANLVTGMEAGVLDTAPIWTDAKTFDARPFRGKVHGIIGGYPCPGESSAGLREGHLYKGFIWPSIRRAIPAARPLWCFFENVDDHLTGTYPIVQRSLRNMGYATEAGIYSAEEVGATHERQRLFIFAMADSYRVQLGRRFRGLSGAAKAAQIASWFQNGQRMRDEPFNGGHQVDNTAGGRLQTGFSGQRDIQQFDQGCEEMGNSNSEGLQVAVCGEQRSLPESNGASQGRKFSRTTPTQWPAGQGTFQYEWEEPRTIESGLGSTINGYNFREDLVRAIGNSVVEQTAEVAFMDLVQKLFLK